MIFNLNLSGQYCLEKGYADGINRKKQGFNKRLHCQSKSGFYGRLPDVKSGNNVFKTRVDGVGIRITVVFRRKCCS
jgi:hypothetical protein